MEIPELPVCLDGLGRRHWGYYYGTIPPMKPIFEMVKNLII